MSARFLRRSSGWRRAPAAGFTLIELMVSMLIGFVVMGAMFTAFSTSNRTNMTATALSQMTEDATLALNLLRSNVRQAGYSRAVGLNVAQGLFNHAWTGRAVFGCNGAFTDMAVGPDALTCSGVGTLDAIALTYEMDNVANGNSLVGADGRPLDCLGNGVDVTVNAGGNYFLSYSRFYVANGGLSCRGPGNASGQLLVDNVSDMQITYGLAAAAGATNVVSYVDAAGVGANWNRVLAVRVCLVVRSATEVLDTVVPYQGCDPFAARTTPADKRLYRAFTATMSIQNRFL